MNLQDFSRDELIARLSKISDERDELRESIDRITEITAAIIYMLDIDGNFTYLNRAVEEILHYAPEELIGKHFSTIMTKSEFERVSRAFVLPRLQGKQVGTERSPKLFDERRTGARRTRNLEVRLLPKEREGVRILVGDVAGIIAVEGAYDKSKVSRSGNKSAGFIGSQGIIFDITRYKKAERERMELQRRLFDTQKMDAIGRLAGKVAHDLNNKLGSIIGCTEVILQDSPFDSPELKSYMETILSASTHAQELANRLMEFSQQDDHAKISLDIHELVSHVLELVGPTVEGRIIIHKSLGAAYTNVVGNPNQLQNAVLNVVTNACDAMALGGGELTVETIGVDLDKEFINGRNLAISPGSFVRISITDTGTGIDPATRSHLFEPFFTTKDVGKGIGLGLASVKDIVKTHGGLIDLESESGKGSRFDLYLPLKNP